MGAAKKPPASGISTATLKHMLHKRAKESSGKSKSSSKSTKKWTSTKSKGVDDSSKPTRKFAFKRRRRRRKTTKKTPAKRAAPKKKTTTVTTAVQTSEAEEEAPSTSRVSKVKKIKTEKSSGKRKRVLDIPLVVVSSEDEDHDGPSTSSGRKKSKKKDRSGFQWGREYDSAEDSDFLPSDEDPNLAEALEQSRREAEEAKKRKVVQPKLNLTDLEFWKVNLKSLLAATPIAVAIANNLPMKSLNAFGQVNRYLSSICRQARNSPLRQSVDFVHRPNFSVALDQGQVLTEEMLFADRLSNLYCEPEFVFAFCSANVMYGRQVFFQSTRSPLEKQRKSKTEFVSKSVGRIIADSLPLAISGKGEDDQSAIVHFRTFSVLPPVPPPPNGNQRKSDPYGVKDSPRDLVLLAIPHIAGVNIWRERLTDNQMKQRLHEGGWLMDRYRSHFLKPILFDLEALGAKLAFVFTKRFPKYDLVTEKEFPVVVVSSMQDQASYHLFDDPLSESRYDIVAFGGKVVAYQVVLPNDLSPSSRATKIEELRDMFTTEQVMLKQMMLFVYRTVSRDDFSHIDPASENMTMAFERDVEQLRERFPKVPIFGGSYLDAVGNVYTKDKNDPEFGTFHAGMNYVIVCAVVLG